MFLTRPYLALAATLGVAMLASPAALATHNDCESGVRKMEKSCYAEAREGYYATRARCNSISDSAERTDCDAFAGEERDEARELCSEQKDARLDVCDDLGEGRYDDPLVDDSIAFIDPDDIGMPGTDDNPYVILRTGHVHVLRSQEYDPETDETSVELIIVLATDEAREIEGKICRVVVDVVVEPEYDDEEGKWEFIPVEVTDDWFAQDVDENVYYCGEIARNYEDGILRDLDGSFEAGRELAEGGLLTLANPTVGVQHRQEMALGEAEDIVQYLSLDADPADEGIADAHVAEQFRCGTEGNTCLMTFDYSPLEPEVTEYKYYLAGTGFVQAVQLENSVIDPNGSEWLLCAEESLEDAFADGSNCGFDDFGADGDDVREELLTELCDLHDEFCEDGEIWLR